MPWSARAPAEQSKCHLSEHPIHQEGVGSAKPTGCGWVQRYATLHRGLLDHCISKMTAVQPNQPARTGKGVSSYRASSIPVPHARQQSRREFVEAPRWDPHHAAPQQMVALSATRTGTASSHSWDKGDRRILPSAKKTCTPSSAPPSAHQELQKLAPRKSLRESRTLRSNERRMRL